MVIDINNQVYIVTRTFNYRWFSGQEWKFFEIIYGAEKIVILEATSKGTSSTFYRRTKDFSEEYDYALSQKKSRMQGGNYYITYLSEIEEF